MYEELISQAEKASKRWREENPIVGVGQLRVDYMVDDLIRAIKDLKRQVDGYKVLADSIYNMNRCEDCTKFMTCEYRPRVGEDTRLNCPLWERVINDD